MGYRHGMMTNLGDLDPEKWSHMVKRVIEREGEQDLFKALLSWVKDHDVLRLSKSEQEEKALILHASHIFDNEGWVDFVAFNRKYRPHLLKDAALVEVITACCQKPGTVTEKQIQNKICSGGTIPCPHCGRWSEYQLMKPSL